MSKYTLLEVCLR